MDTAKAHLILMPFLLLVLVVTKSNACSCSETVRLVDGPTTNAGHIELYYDGKWRAFCDDEIYYDETSLQGGKTAAVVCRSLGYTMGYESVTHSSPYGNSGGHIWLNNVQCEGTESRLEDCTFLGPCRDNFLVGVVCRGEVDCCDKPKVLPEIQHSRTGDIGDIFKPYLQFQCSLQSNETLFYYVKWYVDDKFVLQKGPSNMTADLVLTEFELPKRELGFYVKCGTIVVNDIGDESNETISNQFYAGFKVNQPDVTVSKGGYNTVTVTQTVPIGCQYSENDSPDCSTSLSLYDPNLSENSCDAGISVVNADDDDKCVNEILAQKSKKILDSDIVYVFRIATVDKNYDDATKFDLRLQVGNNANLGLGQNYVVDNTVHVNVESTDSYQNRMCYSHVDPHMRTCDGNHYENQRPGFYMLFHHKESDVEVQEATKYCWGGKSGPVCTCGIAVRAGGDVFMINRCGSINLLDFLHCDDGGIIHVERVNDHKYKILTPTGTKIVANLHYGNTMNIDVFISAKDFGKTEGLCGLCDANSSNDFVHSDGSTSNNRNADYKFSESWRLADNLNLFTFSKRILESWANKNEATCRCANGKCTIQRQRECSTETAESITKTKCDIQNRKRRELGEYNHQKELDRLYGLMSTPRKSKAKRSVETPVTEEEAQAVCNQSVYTSPAVTDFPDKTADEDPDEVVKQCAFDVKESNDKSWANVHVEAINTIATNILELNPVYVANKTEEVNVFMKQTCLNNCSGNGVCTETGKCNCTSWYRGPDCSYDLRVPVVIEDIQGGGECDKANSSNCACFTIRTDNIFDGFFCQTTISRIDKNGQEVTLVDHHKEKGGYEDIFTGTCCITTEQEDFSSEMKDYIHVYKFSASNDGNNFGDAQTVYVYDTTCHDVNINGTNMNVTLKDNFCFIEGQCFYEGEVSLTSCRFCNSTENARNWTGYNQCLNGGTCAYRDIQHTCDCVPGYTGSTCETDIDECLSLPCKNNGTCVDVVNGYICNCSDGYEGQSCETDIDDCVENPCGSGGECVDKVNGFSCNCRQGYTGDVCETDIDECLSQPCTNGGSCVDQVNGYNCTCADGYGGTTCNTEVDECLSDPCQFGNCTDIFAGYVCTCMEGYEGQNCEIDTNDCVPYPCQHSGTCVDFVNSYKCACADGYNGTHCEI
ncbi:uncharacterized protein LOC132751939, partial [Ruditapes philippinarum]|uniref:uncharacterized protein LOC132751939 n=1 Tax=Ruditapes philippinarum TaxID=129788 RepID=UPI00295A9143